MYTESSALSTLKLSCSKVYPFLLLIIFQLVVAGWLPTYA